MEQIQQVLNYFSTYSPPDWDICHTMGPTLVFLCHRSLPSGIENSLSQNTLRITLRADIVTLNFVLHGGPLWRQNIDCCLVSGVMCETRVSSPIMIQSRNSSPSLWYRCRNVNADSTCFDLCSGVSCSVHSKLYHRPHFTVSGSWKRVSIFNRCNYATLPLALLILQPLRRFTYVTAHSPTLPLLHLRHSSISNPSFAYPTSQALHLRHLASRPWVVYF